MLELALKGSKRYYGWIAFLLVLIGIGSIAYVNQLIVGLETTGMNRGRVLGLLHLPVHLPWSVLPLPAS